MARTDLPPQERIRTAEGAIHPNRSSGGVLPDAAAADHDFSDEDNEHQTLLAGGQRPRRDSDEQHGAFSNRREDHSPRPSRNRKHGTREIMHEMEEGGPHSRASSEDSGLEYEREKMGAFKAKEQTRRKRSWCGLLIMSGFIFGLFVAVAYGAYKASKETRHVNIDFEWLSNGTALFAPTTILVSLDGFRADFLQRNLTPTLNRFIKEGVSPKYMDPSFPSLTFPNHYTLVTGLHPESHGIVANSFWDEELQDYFTYTDAAHSMQPKWWYPHPLWETAELQDVPTAIHMWPGSEAHIGQVQPLHIDKYNGSEILARKVDRVLDWLDKAGPKDAGYQKSDSRPQLIAAYVPNVDSDGHLYGPNSTQIRATIREADDMLATLFEGLRARNLTEIVNVVVVSDHGMATTSTERLVQYEDLVEPDLIEHIDGWPHYGLRPKDMKDVPRIHEKLVNAASKLDGIEVYLQDEIPERYHFRNNHRIAPLWIIAKTGWAIVTKDEYDIEAGHGPENDKVYHPRGVHGYDNQHPLMRAIFVARGPAFPHAPGSRLAPFQNTEVYNIICDSLKVEPHPNNGTLRLPLKPVGLHGDEGDHEVVSDPEEEKLPEEASPPAALPTNRPTVDEPNPDAERPSEPADGHSDKNHHANLVNYLAWVEWVKAKFGSALNWIKSSGHAHPQPGGDDQQENRAQGSN